MIEPGRAPSVRRIAMSACLSVTAITSVETMLNAATATISVQDDEHHALLDLHRAEEVGVAARPVAHVGIVRGSARSSSRATARRLEQVVELQAHAGHRRPGDRAFCASSRWISARPESYSNMPTSKMPTTVNCFRRGRMPAGVTLPCGAISTTLSPRRHAERAGQLRPSTMPNSPGSQVVQRPTRMCEPMSATRSPWQDRLRARAPPH